MSPAPDDKARHRPGWVNHGLELDVRDPNPLSDASKFWRSTAQAATIVMSVVMIGAVLFLARGLVVPLLCALAVGLTLGPILEYAERHGIPSWLQALAVIVLLIGIIETAFVLLTGPATSLISRAPELGGAIADKLHFFDQPLQSLSDLQASLGIKSPAMDFNPSSLIAGFLTTVTPAALEFVLESVLFFASLFFFILGRKTFRKYTIERFSARKARLRALKILNDIEANLGGYLVVVTVINVALGCITALVAFALGLPTPILWGALAFVLNYVPYVGPAVMDVLLFIIGLVTFPTLLGALLPPAIFIAITTIEGQFLTPAIVGRRVLNLHPLAIFLSIAFWAWLWGPVGAFLATPILIVVRVVLAHSYPEQRPELPG